MERSKRIFGNPIAEKDYRKACRQKAKYRKKFGDDSGTDRNHCHKFSSGKHRDS